MKSNSQIQQNLWATLKAHPKLDTTHMKVEVEHDIAYLSGWADTDEERLLAAKLAASCPGIMAVQNDLKIGSGILHTITSLVSGLAANNEKELHKEHNKPGSS